MEIQASLHVRQKQSLGTTPMQEYSLSKFSINERSKGKKTKEEWKLKKKINQTGKSVLPSLRKLRQQERNERERNRQESIRRAFEVLRGAIPNYISGKKPGEKLSRNETLRLAKQYIIFLRGLLMENSAKNNPKEKEPGIPATSEV